MNTYTPHFEDTFLSSSFSLKGHYIYALLVNPATDRQLFFCLAPDSKHMFPSSWKLGKPQLSKRHVFCTTERITYELHSRIRFLNFWIELRLSRHLFKFASREIQGGRNVLQLATCCSNIHETKQQRIPLPVLFLLYLFTGI
jgi:hypothetical protein